MAESIDIRELNILIEQKSAFVSAITTGMNKVIVGQKHLVDSLSGQDFGDQDLVAVD